MSIRGSNLSRLQLLMLTGFGLGYLRPAPGTWGSLPPVGLALACVWLASYGVIDLPAIVLIDLPLVILGVAFTIGCIRFGAMGEMHFKRKDASYIVADEVAGQSLTLLFLPWQIADTSAAWQWNLKIAAIAFFMFRVMDIIKPPPARSLQRIPGGLGVAIDDLFAGVYALVATQIIVRLLMTPPLAA